MDKAPNPAEVVMAEVAKYGDELVPGAAEKLGAVWASLARMPPDKRAEAVAKNMEGEFAARFRDPEKVAAKLADGADASPLRMALMRNAGRLAPGAVDALTSQLAGQVAGQSPAQIAGHVERFLGSREAHPHLAIRPPDPPHVMRLDDIVRRHFPGEVNSDQMAALYRDRRVSGMPEASVVSMIARTLGLPSSDSRHGGRPASIEYRQPLAPPTGEARPRGVDGTFLPAEPTPPKRSLAR